MSKDQTDSKSKGVKPESAPLSEPFRNPKEEKNEFLSSATGYGEDYRFEADLKSPTKSTEPEAQVEYRDAGFNSRPSETYEREDYFKASEPKS